MNASDFLKIITNLQAGGFSLHVLPDGRIDVRDEAARRRAKKSARQARWRLKKKTGNAEAPTKRLQNDYKAPTDRELNWRDMPGHDEAAKKMNLSLFKRKLLSQYAHLHGKPVPEIKAEFSRINAPQKAKSQIAAKKRTADAKARREG